MQKKFSRNAKYAPEFYGLGVGESLVYPAKRLRTMRAQASLYGFEWGRTYSVHLNREENNVTVVREA